MGEKIQDGIYFTERFSGSFSNNNDRLSQSNNKTFALVFLEAREGAIAERIGKDLACLWKMYDSLKKGLISNLPKCRVPTGNLDILIGYGPRIFSIKGAKKSIPNDMRDMQFSRSDIGDEPICLNSGIRFAKDIHENLGLSEHVILQFTSETQLATYRAIVQTWRFFSGESKREISLKLTRFKTGFQRDDGRSWLGFHDPISNLRDPTERIGVIAINKKWNRLMPTDQWTQHGTYLAFLKIVINLEIWEQLDRREQELAIGRDKVSGRPILAVDMKGKPILDENCPSFEAVEGHHAHFHDHPNYFVNPSVSRGKSRVDTRKSLLLLNQSHVGRTRHIDGVDSRDPASNRIFRQGFDFADPTTDPSTPVRVGLNFISFQNDPRRLFSILSSPHWLGGSNFGGDPNVKRINNLMSVESAGLFFIPSKQKPFPGADIFL